MGAHVEARRREALLDRRIAPSGAAEEPALLLRGKVLGRAEPALETVAVRAVQVENDHMQLILACFRFEAGDEGFQQRLERLDVPKPVIPENGFLPPACLRDDRPDALAAARRELDQ